MDHASLPDHVAGDYRAGRVGYFGLVDMPKQEFPEFTIRQGVVVGVYPGRLPERWRSSWPSLWRDTCLPSRR